MAQSRIREDAARASLYGPLLMIVAMFCFVALDAILKLLVMRYDGLLLSWGRCLIQVVLVGALVPFIGGTSVLATARPWLQAGRGVCLAVTSVAMIVASRVMPLTEIYIIAFASPLIATIIARLALAEAATPLQWALIVTGFLGVLVAMNPTAPTAGLILLLPLAQACGNGVYHVLTRVCGRTDGPFAQLFHSATFATLILSVLLPWVWTPMATADAALLLFGGGLVTFGHFLLIKAFTLAPTARVSPMVYSQIIWSTLFGYLLFGDLPPPTTWIGGAIIVVTGILLIRSRG
ncbi:MAG: DMT family transporter [Hyphomicrobiaceae bacterium]